MHTIKVSKAKLLTHLRENREVHIKEYTEAMEGYRKELVTAIKKKLAAAKKGLNVDHTINLTRPSNYTDSYDEAIAMLEWNTEDEVELDHTEFTQYVQDEWGWKNSFSAVSRSYAVGKKT